MRRTRRRSTTKVSYVLLGASLSLQSTAAPPLAVVAPREPRGLPLSQLTLVEQQFVQLTAQALRAHIALGRLALERSTSDPVRAHASAMLASCDELAQELQQLAARKSVELPAELAEQDRARLADLANLAGEAFDQAYWRSIGDAQPQASLLYRRNGPSSHDRELDLFADKALAVLGTAVGPAPAQASSAQTHGPR